MTTYMLLKLLHVLSSTVLFGTGMGIAFFKWITDRTGDVRAIRIVTERTVLADYVFTTPAVILQPITGLAMVWLAGYPLFSTWIVWSVGLYLLAGVCWLPVVWLQIRLRDIARVADSAGTSLPPGVLAPCPLVVPAGHSRVQRPCRHLLADAEQTRLSVGIAGLAFR